MVKNVGYICSNTTTIGKVPFLISFVYLIVVSELPIVDNLDLGHLVLQSSGPVDFVFYKIDAFLALEIS